MKIQQIMTVVALGVVLVLSGCSKKDADKPTGAKPEAAKAEAAKPDGPFKLAWSEYPSWSVFDVAHSKGFINGKEGELGPIEEKWNVDIVLKEAEYDPCITMYGAGQVDATAITNMDILSPSLSRKAVAILPTSTSYGADAVLVTNDIADLAALKGVEVRGLDLSVSEYMFARNLELKGEDPKNYKFKSMDPGAAAMAMQQGQDGMKAIAVWNPFVLQTLSKRAGEVKVMFDSSSIPGEIIDMVVVAEDSLKKPGGKAFAHAVIDAYYAVNRDLADAAKRDDTLKAIGEKFSNLSVEEMKKVVEQTRFYGTPEAGIGLFNDGPVLAGVSETKLTEVMPRVLKFSEDYGILKEKATVVYGAEGEGHLRFDSSYMKAVADSLKTN